jgi:hypothetical protein
MNNSVLRTSQQAISTTLITSQLQVDAAVDRVAEHPQASFSLNMRSKDAEQGRKTYAVSSWLSEDVEQRRETCAVSSSRSEANARRWGGGRRRKRSRRRPCKIKRPPTRNAFPSRDGRDCKVVSSEWELSLQDRHDSDTTHTHTHTTPVLQYCEILYKNTEKYVVYLNVHESIYMPATKRSASFLHCPCFSPPVTTSPQNDSKSKTSVTRPERTQGPRSE